MYIFSVLSHAHTRFQRTMSCTQANPSHHPLPVLILIVPFLFVFVFVFRIPILSYYLTHTPRPRQKACLISRPICALIFYNKIRIHFRRWSHRISKYLCITTYYRNRNRQSSRSFVTGLLFSIGIFFWFPDFKWRNDKW